MSDHHTKLFQEYGEWRWICTCGSKGIRLLFKEDVERLAENHVRSKTKKERYTRYTQEPYNQIFRCNDCGTLVVDSDLHDRFHRGVR